MEPTPSPARRVSVSAHTIVSTAELHNNDVWTPERVFQALDTDGSKALDVGEFTTGLTAVLNRKVAVGEADKIFKKADTDSNGRLAYAEFEKFCKSGKLGKSFVGYFMQKTKGGVVDADVLASRQKVLAMEMSRGGEKVSGGEEKVGGVGELGLNSQGRRSSSRPPP